MKRTDVTIVNEINPRDMPTSYYRKCEDKIPKNMNINEVCKDEINNIIANSKETGIYYVLEDGNVTMMAIMFPTITYLPEEVFYLRCLQYFYSTLAYSAQDQANIKECIARNINGGYFPRA